MRPDSSVNHTISIGFFKGYLSNTSLLDFPHASIFLVEASKKHTRRCGTCVFELRTIRSSGHSTCRNVLWTKTYHMGRELVRTSLFHHVSVHQVYKIRCHIVSLALDRSVWIETRIHFVSKGTNRQKCSGTQAVRRKLIPTSVEKEKHSADRCRKRIWRVYFRYFPFPAKVADIFLN